MSEMPTTVTERDYYFDPDVREEIADAIASNPLGGGLTELYRALPAEHGFDLPEDGGWIIVKRQPHTAIEAPPLYSIWRAERVYSSRKFKISAHSRRRWVNWPMLKARLLTPNGSLDLFPDEYVPTDISKWLDMIGDGVEINFLGREPDEIKERIFYLRAHGLDRAQAASLVLPEITDSNYCYLTLEV